MLALGFPVLSLSILFLDGLTLVCLVGTVLLFVVFGFLFFVEKKMNKHQ